MMPPTSPIPDELMKRLSTRAGNVLAREQIETCGQLLALRKPDMRRFRGSGRRTTDELSSLQDKLLRACPELNPPRQQEPDDCSTAVPALPSMLDKTIPELFALPPLPFERGQLDFPAIESIGLPAVDLDRLRFINLFAGDSIELFCSVTAGYLAEADLSDDALAAVLASAGSLCGVPRLAPASVFTPAVPDEFLLSPPGLEQFGSLPVPVSPFPALTALLQDRPSPLTWRELSTITERTVIETLGFSRMGLRAVNELWRLRQTVLDVGEAAGAGFTAEVYGDFDSLLKTYLRLGLRCRQERVSGTSVLIRDYEIMSRRLGLADGRKWTLRELALHSGLTRERVRQIELNTTTELKKDHLLEHLGYFRMLLGQFLASRGGGALLSEVAAALCDSLHWPVLPGEQPLSCLVGMLPECEVVAARPVRVALVGHRCAYCEGARDFMSAAVKSEASEGLPIDSWISTAEDFCRRSGCPQIGSISGLSQGFVHAMSGATEGISVEGGSVKGPPPLSMAQRIVAFISLEMAATPGKQMHWKEALHRFSQATGIGVQRSIICGALDESPLFLRWDHGTFVLKEHASIPTTLIKEIAQDIDSRLNAMGLPYVCINGLIFENYRCRLLAENVPTPLALYSSLRVVGSETLGFAEYPYVGRKGDKWYRPTISHVLEDYLKRNGPLLKSELHAYGAEVVGVEPVQLRNYISRIQNRLHISRLLVVHAEAVGVEKEQLAPIVDSLDGSEINARKLYRQHCRALAELGISTPMFLHSLLEYFYPGRFKFSSIINGRLATLLSPVRTARKTRTTAEPSSTRGETAADSTDRRWRDDPLLRLMTAHLEERGAPCRPRVLIEQFAAMGNSALCLHYLGRDKGKVLRYSDDAVIARRALHWTGEKQMLIEDLAARHLAKREQQRHAFGSCREMLTEMSGQLPELDGAIRWTSVLLNELLVSSGRFLVVGRAKDLFLPADNRDGIRTPGDLALHILKSEHDGVAHKGTFLRQLRTLGIRPRWVKNGSGLDRRIVVDGRIVHIAGIEVPEEIRKLYPPGRRLTVAAKDGPARREAGAAVRAECPHE